MTTQRAVKIVEKGVVKVVTDVPIQNVRKGKVLVKVKAVALNPTDWKHVWNIPDLGTTVGCDFAGVVEEVGPGDTKYQKGDRITGFVHGSNWSGHEDGCFSNYTLGNVGVSGKVPDHMSWEEGATLGVAITTVGQGMYQSLGLALPSEPVSDKTPLLVYGGSTATGSIAIQFGKLSGYQVITTASPRNHELLKSLGADHVIDYNDPQAGQKIRELTNDKLKFAFDCISEGSSPKICFDAISSTGGTYGCILPVKSDREDVVSKFTLGYTAFGEDYVKLGRTSTAKPEDLEFAAKFWQLASKLLEEGKIKAHPHKLVDGGLDTIPQSIQDLKDGKASGFKFVHRID